MNVRKLHWDDIYGHKEPNEVSWTQEIPETSLAFIKSLNIPRSGSIIDIGGGDSKLVDFLLDEGYTDITVLDISEKALERVKNRLGKAAANVTWIVSDIADFRPEKSYDVWHDRATFHFLTTVQQISAYVKIAALAVKAYLVVGTFSENGPEKCSGLPIKQYSETELEQTLAKGFNKIKCVSEDHKTPFNTFQNFLFCSFARMND